MDFKKIFKELKRRKVYHVAVTYAITVWLVAQVLDLALDTFEAPSWVMQMALILLFIGFPIALILAWAYELSPQGVVRTDTEVASGNPDTPSQRRPLIYLGIIGLLVATIVFLLFYKSNFWETKPTPDLPAFHAPNSIPIAMLPLINLSEDKQLSYFSSQLTNDIINELAKVRSFAVTAFTTVYDFEGQGRSPEMIAESFGVDYLMRGSARAYEGGDSIKIDVELIDPLTGRRLWGESYKELMGQAPALQAAIAKKVATNLNVQLTPAETASLAGDKTRNGQAYLKFLEARQEYNAFYSDAMASAIRLLEEAIQLDPEYTEARTLLAWILNTYSWPAFKTNEASLIRNKIRIDHHLETALAQNPNSSDIYLVKANYTMTYLDDLQVALGYVDKALKINSWPELPTTHCVCTAVTMNIVLGNLQRAKEIEFLARQIEPGSIMILNDAFFIDLVEGNFEEATKKMEQALQLMDVPVFRFQTGWAYLNEGRYREAIEMLHSAYPDPRTMVPAAVAYLSNAHYSLGEQVDSDRYKSRLDSLLLTGETNVLIDLAVIAAARGEEEETLNYLERHLNEAPIGLSFQLNTEPVFHKFKDLPRFLRIRERIGYFE
ncbi:hypothetical protein ACA086_01780 [Muriicola sp. E247]|uniref:hypothetical protein n=1 Tax=Muriicola sp. E247 TaxID=3242730 RepID=UPI003524925C